MRQWTKYENESKRHFRHFRHNGNGNKHLSFKSYTYWILEPDIERKTHYEQCTPNMNILIQYCGVPNIFFFLLHSGGISLFYHHSIVYRTNCHITIHFRACVYLMWQTTYYIITSLYNVHVFCAFPTFLLWISVAEGFPKLYFVLRCSYKFRFILNIVYFHNYFGLPNLFIWLSFSASVCLPIHRLKCLYKYM